MQGSQGYTVIIVSILTELELYNDQLQSIVHPIFNVYLFIM